MIFHIISEQDWKKARDVGFYAPKTLENEGFIHCSKKEQVLETLAIYYRNTPHLLLLEIDETLLTSELKFEHAESRNDDFPHVFGPLNISAVVNTYPLARNNHGEIQVNLPHLSDEDVTKRA